MEQQTENKPVAANAGAEPSPPKKKKRLTFLWVLGWIFCFPIPLTVIIHRNQHIKPVGKVFIIIGVWLTAIVIAMNISVTTRSINGQDAVDISAGTPDQSGVSARESADVTQLYPQLIGIEELDAVDSYTPQCVDNYLILRVDNDRVRVIAGCINGDRSLKYSRDQLEDLDVIITAVVGGYSQRYDLYVDGEKQDSSTKVYVETAEIYGFEPETGAVFKGERVAAATLAKQKDCLPQTDFRLSNDNIIYNTSKQFSLKQDFLTRFRLWFTQELGFLLFIGIAVAVGFFFLIRGSWRAGLKKRRALQAEAEKKQDAQNGKSEE